MSVLCNINSVQGMKCITTQTENSCDLALDGREPDSPNNLGLNLITINAPEPSPFALIRGAQLQRKLQAKQTKLQLALKAVMFRRSNYRKTLYKQYLAAISNRIASERLVVKDLDCERI